MQWLANPIGKTAWRARAPETFHSMAALDDVRSYLKLCPAYKKTRVVNAPDLARTLNIGQLSIKDETNRMGLGNFKALGGAYAIFDMMAARAAQACDAPLSIDNNVLETLKPLCKDTVFCCASAGNHGLSVLVGAKHVGARAVIFLADTVPENFAERLRHMGAEVCREGVDYDASMEAARRACTEKGWILISDSAWAGYEEIPQKVMRGYSIISEEIMADGAVGQHWPTHVFLQAGVGGLAGALANHIRLTWPEQPTIIVVEPEKAACLLESIRAGKLSQVHAPGSNMGRLDCAIPSLTAYQILKDTADYFIAVSDEAADTAVEQLSPLNIATTPSGSAGFAGLHAMATNPDLRAEVGIDENAHCLCIASERSLSI